MFCYFPFCTFFLSPSASPFPLSSPLLAFPSPSFHPFLSPHPLFFPHFSIPFPFPSPFLPLCSLPPPFPFFLTFALFPFLSLFTPSLPPLIHPPPLPSPPLPVFTHLPSFSPPSDSSSPAPFSLPTCIHPPSLPSDNEDPPSPAARFPIWPWYTCSLYYLVIFRGLVVRAVRNRPLS